MRKARKEKIEQEVEVIEMICCNKCGKKYENKNWVGNLHEFHIDFATYFSKFNADKWNFDLCEDCIVDIVRTFKFTPEGFYQYDTRTMSVAIATPSIENELQKLNRFVVVDRKQKENDDVEFALIEQTNEFCLFLEQLKPLEWEVYLTEHGDGEFVNVAPIARELGASKYTLTEKFH